VVVEELAEEAAKAPEASGDRVSRRPRGAWVIGSGLDVWEIVELLSSYEADVPALRSDHPLITEHHVRTARAYATQFPEELADDYAIEDPASIALLIPGVATPETQFADVVAPVALALEQEKRSATRSLR
jgi:hypothetical protein